MFRMTKAADYSIVILAYLAGSGEESAQTARSVSADTHLPLPMVTKTMKLLASKGLLISQRGVKGGYRLSGRPENLSVSDIIAAVEGPITLTECTGDLACDCPVEPSCQVRGPWQTINQAVLRTLRSIPLSAMAKSLKPLPQASSSDAGRKPGV